MHSETLDLRKVLRHFEAQVSHFSTGTAALFGRRLHSVIVSDAYQEFLRYCQMGNLTRVEFTEFKRVAKELVLEKFQLGLRHDIRTAEGRQTHGWKHIRLLPDPSGQAIDAA